MLPSVLYQPTEYDFRTGANAQRVTRRVAGQWTILGSGPQDLYDVPVNKILVLEHAFGAAYSAGASAETLRQLILQVFSQPVTPSIADLFDVRNNTAAGFGQSRDVLWQGRYFCMPGERISFNAVKSGAVDTFQFAATIAGLLIPRANVQLG